MEELTSSEQAAGLELPTEPVAQKGKLLANTD